VVIVDLPGRPDILVVMSNFLLGDEVVDMMNEISKAASDYFQRIIRSTLYGTYSLAVTP